MALKLLNLAAAAALIVMLGIVGTVERGGDLALMWWTLPCFAVMVLAALVNRKKIFSKRF